MGVFYESKEYAHGGATLQAAVVPELTVTRAGAPVADDEQDGCAAVVVLVDAAGRVVAKQATTVGER